jgi:hypothetical protein
MLLDKKTGAHDPVESVIKKGTAHAIGAQNVKPLCITANSMEGRTDGTLALTTTTISTADTTLQWVDTDPSRNNTLHAAPVRNGLPMTVTEAPEERSTGGVTLMMTGAWASRSVIA